MHLTREQHTAFCRENFAFASAVGPEVSATPGGRVAALEALRNIRPAKYAATRNHLDGDVTRLSPYLRHGCLSLAEVRDAAVAKSPGYESLKLVTELAWRDYYQRVYAHLGNDIWDDLEPFKTGRQSDDYADDLPEDIRTATTGLACMDGFSDELRDTGYLHNHARMWTAAYVVHHRRVKWQAGAHWFLEHLLDGDPASNNLSWQWVASTFSHKPYFFNRENLSRFTSDHYCPTCPARRACPFDADYDTLSARLFPSESFPESRTPPVKLKVLGDRFTLPSSLPTENAVVWAHEDALSSAHPAYSTGAPTLFVHDAEHYRARRYSLKRILFIHESAAELDGTAIEVGDPAERLIALARKSSSQQIIIPTSPSPRIREVAHELAKTLRVIWVEPLAFVSIPGPLDLTRFSRYWRVAEKHASRATP